MNISQKLPLLIHMMQYSCQIENLNGCRSQIWSDHVTFQKTFSLLPSRSILKAPLKGSQILRSMTDVCCIFSRFQTGTFGDTVLRRSSHLVINAFVQILFSKLFLVGSQVLRSMIHVTCIFVEYRTGAITDCSFKAITRP